MQVYLPQARIMKQHSFQHIHKAIHMLGSVLKISVSVEIGVHARASFLHPQLAINESRKALEHPFFVLTLVPAPTPIRPVNEKNRT